MRREEYEEVFMRTAKWVTLIIGGGAILFVLLLMGCVHDSSRRAGYREPPPDYVEFGGVVRDDYYYYPGYQVYYSSSRHHYVYLEGGAWITRPAPPSVSVEVLFASPSVRLDFHDAPSIHHSRIVKQYPKHWSPPGHDKGNRGNGKGKNGRVPGR
jgi:hypothetical protein